MMKLESHGDELKEQDSNIKEAEKLLDSALGDTSKLDMATAAIHGLWAPYHPMIDGWHDIFYPRPPSWDPDHNPSDMAI